MKKLYILFASFALLIACNSNSSEAEVETVTEVETEEITQERISIVLEDKGITLTGNNYATSYPNAVLTLNNFEESSLQVGKNEFYYEVENYNLTENTEDELSVMCANSGKGQHIHFIMDNAPYKALYEPKAEDELEEGHHVLLSFLSRSYHMSIKNGTAHTLQEFNVGDGEYTDEFDETEPHMFYSRPKGTYKGADAERVLLDFFLINTDLASSGYTVMATINESIFKLDHWLPYIMEGLPMGTNTITLELLDADGNRVESPYNPVVRTIELTEE